MKIPARLFALCLLAPPIPAQDTEPWSALERSLTERVERGEAPSLAVGVLRAGRVVWQGAIGRADIERDIATTTQTRYPLGSMSKSIAATAALTLVERGLVSLDDPLANWLGEARVGEYAGLAQDVTLERALGMRAGIAHGSVNLSPDEPVWGLDQQLARGLVIAFPPGTYFLYSNYSLLVAEAAVETAAGQPFRAYVRDAVFQPLGMTRSSVGPPDEETAVSYDRQLNPITRRHFLPAGAGGMYSSVEDLLRYAAFHLGRGPGQPIIAAELLARMHRPVDDLSSYGLGWGAGPMGLVTNGNIRGACSNLTLLPDEDLAVVCLSNVTGASNMSVADAVVMEIIDTLVPGYSARVQEWVAAQGRRRGSTLPAGIAGAWRGHVEHNAGKRAARLVIQASGATTLRIADGDEAQFTVSPRGLDAIGGQARVDLGIPEAEGASVVQLRLRLVNGQLFGSLEAQFLNRDDFYAIPAFGSFERESGRD